MNATTESGQISIFTLQTHFFFLPCRLSYITFFIFRDISIRRGMKLGTQGRKKLLESDSRGPRRRLCGTHFLSAISRAPNTLVNLCLSSFERVPTVSFITIVPMPAAAILRSLSPSSSAQSFTSTYPKFSLYRPRSYFSVTDRILLWQKDLKIC